MEQKKLRVGLVTTVSGRWPKELPDQRHQEYSDWLTDNFPEISFMRSPRIVATNQDLQEIIAGLRKEAVDLIIMILGAFTGDLAATSLAEELKVPLILWAPNEPPFDGGRLIANSLVAATMNAAAMHRLGLKYHFIYGDYSKERVRREVAGYLRVYDTIKKLRNTFLGLAGYRPIAFYSSTFDETLIRKNFGVKMEEYDLKQLFDLAEGIDQERVKIDAEMVAQSVDNLDLPEGYLENHCRLFLALEEFIKAEGLTALTLKCWPEMGSLKYTPCAVLSRFADRDFIIGCESDVDATLTMLIQKYLTGQMTFMGDLIRIDETRNTALFWHCGQAGLQLKDPLSPVFMTNHPLAGQGTAFQTTLKSGIVTVARMSNIGGRYKMFLTRGQAIPTVKEVTGVMVDVVLEAPVLETIYRIAEAGVPHHYSLVWEDLVDDLEMFCKILDIEILE